MTSFFLALGKLHRALRLSVEHIPDSGLQDIQEEDEDGVEEESEEEINSDDELDEEDGSREGLLNQDGVTSDENDIEPFSKSRDCMTFSLTWLCYSEFSQSVLF